MKLPDELRTRVSRDLKRVRPHFRPWQRALLLVPAALLAFAAAPVALGIRGDFGNLGTLLAWGGSIAQLAVAIVLMVAALREAVPGEAVPSSVGRLLLAAGAGFTICLGIVTNLVSPEHVARSESYFDWLFCWRGVLLTGLPLLLALLVLLTRGLARRPGLAGALAGMAAGAAVDGGWRLYCNYSNTSHVIPSHGGAVLALTLIGAGAAVTIAWLRQNDR